MTEDYVSLEISKLLKEKGFNISLDSKNWLFCMYDEIGNIHWGVYDKNGYFRITHQMAMKWLREEKGVYMSIDTVISLSGNIYFNINTYSENSGWNYPVDFYDSYEEAVEVALKYCLENLI